MLGKDIFKIWAPLGSRWIEWVRPVPFIEINKNINNYEFYDFVIPDIYYINELLNDTAFIIDLPSYNGVKEALALAKLGYRPIPIYNGTNEPEGALATTNNKAISKSLIWGALELNKLNISNEAPPAFLLDTNRLNRYKMNESVFDNSWDIYPQDIPSIEYFLKNGIKKIIIRSEKNISKDLNKILYKYQKEIKILFTNGFEEPKEIKIKKSLKDK